MLRETLMVLICTTSAAHAERFTHFYEMRVAGLRVAEARVAAVTERGRYSADVIVEGRGFIGFLAGAEFRGDVQGLYSGGLGYRPVSFSTSGQRGGEERGMEMQFIGDTPVSVEYVHTREADADPVPDLTRQSGTVDFVTAVLVSTLPGTPDEICSRDFETFTGTRRTRFTTQYLPASTDMPARCSVDFERLDPESLDPIVDEDDERVTSYTIELRPLNDTQYEVARIVGVSPFGAAIIERIN